MKVLFSVLLLFCSFNCIAQHEDAKFKVLSIEDAGLKGVNMTINVKAKDLPDNNKTVVYYLVDHQSKQILHSLSDKNGVIDLYINNFKYIKYVYIGGPGYFTTKIDLTQFKGKNAVIELEIMPDLRPLID
jgi:hypothetical protein